MKIHQICPEQVNVSEKHPKNFNSVIPNVQLGHHKQSFWSIFHAELGNTQKTPNISEAFTWEQY